jgi:hypothetical protein
MSGMSSILFTHLSNNVQSILNASLSGIGSTSNANSTTASGVSSSASQSDSSQLSPFAQLMSTLQQLQLSNPAQYQQVTQQIATNLQTAAQTATSDGNTTAATQLNQLATDFTNASQSGQLPDVQDLAQAVGGGHHHHHHHHAASATSGSDGSSGTTTTGTTTTGTSSSSDISQLLSQIQAAFQANATQNDSLDPASIIFNTLNSAGVSAVTST